MLNRRHVWITNLGDLRWIETYLGESECKQTNTDNQRKEPVANDNLGKTTTTPKKKHETVIGTLMEVQAAARISKLIYRGSAAGENGPQSATSLAATSFFSFFPATEPVHKLIYRKKPNL